MLRAGRPPSVDALPRRWSSCLGGCFATGAIGDELSSPHALVWSYSSPVVLRALSDSEESIVGRGSVIFSGGCFAAEGFSVDALPLIEVIVCSGGCFAFKVAWTDALSFGDFYLRLHFTTRHQHVELFYIRFSYLVLSCGGFPTSFFLLSFLLWTSLVIHGLHVNPLFRLLFCSMSSPT